MKNKLFLLFLFVIAAMWQPLSAFAACDSPKIVVLGDSLVAGFGLNPGDAFPEKLSQALTQEGLEVEIANAGVSGDTTSGGLSRLNWSVGDDVDGVILELGANDALRGIPVEVTRKNLDAMIRQLKMRDIDVLLTGMMAPPNMGEAYGSAFNAIYAELAEKHDVAFYPFFLEGVAADPALNLEDGIHPNPEGIEVIVENIMPDVKAFLATLCGSEAN